MTPDDPRHGRPRGFHAHVRDGEEPCFPCRDAINRYERTRRKTRALYRLPWEIDATGTRRRIEALYWMGWRGVDIARRIGANQARLAQIAHQESVHRHTAAAIAGVFDELSMTTGPSVITRARAKQKGYLPPLAWNNIDDPDEQPRTRVVRPLKTDIDPVVVQRVLAGDKLPTTRAEKLEITARWEAAGRTLKDLERLTGWRSDRYTVREAS